MIDSAWANGFDDLFPLIGRALLRRWKLIVGTALITLLVVALGVAVLERVAPRYQSRVDILITGSKYQLAFDPKFVTVDGISGATNAQAVAAAIAARAAEFRSIALSPEVRRAAEQNLLNMLPSEERYPGVLNGDVDVRVTGAMISILATAGNPVRAARIADAWAAAARDRLNDVYGQTSEDRAVLERKLAEATASYQDAEARLTEFTRENRLDELSRRIQEKEGLKQNLTRLSAMQSSLVADQLVKYYGALADLGELARDARALREQIQAAGQSAASLAAEAFSLVALEGRLVSLGSPSGQPSRSTPSLDERGGNLSGGNATKTGAPAEVRINVNSSPTSSNSPVRFQVSADSLIQGSNGPQRMLHDLDALLATVELRRSDFLAAIEESTGQLATGNSTQKDGRIETAIQQLGSEIRRLQTDLREETLRRESLTQKLEAAKAARDTLQTKVQETDIAAATSGNKAVVVSSASAGSHSFPGPVSSYLLLASVAGLMIGILVAAAIELLAGKGERMPMPVPVTVSAVAE